MPAHKALSPHGGRPCGTTGEYEGLELTFGDGDQIYLQGVTAPLADRDLVFG